MCSDIPVLGPCWPTPKISAICDSDGKPLAIAILFTMFLRETERPHCGLAGDRDICEDPPQKTRKIAKEKQGNPKMQ